MRQINLFLAAIVIAAIVAVSFGVGWLVGKIVL